MKFRGLSYFDQVAKIASTQAAIKKGLGTKYRGLNNWNRVLFWGLLIINGATKCIGNYLGA